MGNLKIGSRLIISFILIGLVPFAVIGAISLFKSQDSLEKASFNQLLGVREIKKRQIENFFTERKGDMGVLTETVSTLRREANQKLSAVRDIKKTLITNYFTTIQGQITTFAESKTVVDAMRSFTVAFEDYQLDMDVEDEQVEQYRVELADYYKNHFGAEYKKQNGIDFDVEAALSKLSLPAVFAQHKYITQNENPLGEKHKLDANYDGSSYAFEHDAIHPIISHYLEKFSFYDIFLIEPITGHIVYSVYKELDFGTSLETGPWAQSGLAEAYKKAKSIGKGEFAFVDYKLYSPSYDAPAGFIASPIFVDNDMIGILAFQMPLDKITEIMSDRAGLGQTGETLLIGPEYNMRSDTYLDKENRSVVASFRKPENGKIETADVKEVFERSKTGVHYVLDYRKKPTISAFTPLKIGDVTWALVAKIDISEAFVPVDEEGIPFFEKYVKEYGYYDLFLIDQTGFVFYSAAKEADYQTNMVNGKYAGSGLGELTRKVMETKTFGLADFAPYAPSNNEPAAFIAQPVVEKEQIQVVVALQLSLAALNGIMQQRDGMGETGETYLIGQDKLMRSDSFLDPKGHSVKASFANPKTGSVDTKGAREAIAGKHGEEIIIDYNGNPVLSAYTSVDIGDGTKWGLLAEVDESEAFAAITDLEKLMIVVALVGALAISTSGYFIAKSISTPINMMTARMTSLAEGEKESDIPGAERSDEIGDMADAVVVFKDNMIKADKLAEEQRLEQEAKQKRAETIDELLHIFDEESTEALGIVASAAHEMSASANAMSEIAKNTSQQAGMASAATEQTSANVQSVATATEELAASANEINRQITQSTEIGVAAVDQAAQTNEMIQGLSDSVSSIGEVVDLITSIAEQTNLLALNATIEAARAGDAGKGFAVVAGEVKNLADQTGKATDEISKQIGLVQDRTGEAVTAIQDITGVIEQISEVSASIAAAMEEQEAATGEITRSVQEASDGTREVAENVSHVNEGATETEKSSGEVSVAAEDVSKQTEDLKEKVHTFLQNIRVA